MVSQIYEIETTILEKFTCPNLKVKQEYITNDINNLQVKLVKTLFFYIFIIILNTKLRTLCEVSR